MSVQVSSYTRFCRPLCLFEGERSSQIPCQTQLVHHDTQHQTPACTLLECTHIDVSSQQLLLEIAITMFLQKAPSVATRHFDQWNTLHVLIKADKPILTWISFAASDPVSSYRKDAHLDFICLPSMQLAPPFNGDGLQEVNSGVLMISHHNDEVIKQRDQGWHFLLVYLNVKGDEKMLTGQVDNTENATAETDQNSGKQSAFVPIVVTIAALGGLLFGYDQGVISGAINFLSTHFHMGSGMAGFVSGSIPLGAMVGCLLAGFLSDKIGRKYVLFIAGLLFIVGSLACAFSNDVALLVIGRLIGGLGVGMASTLVPLYISEIAPAWIRGRLVGAYQLAIAGGMFIVYIINAIIANTHTLEWNLLTGWRWMFAAGAIPGVLFFVLLFLVPESPRYLVEKGDQDQARSVLTKIGGSKSAETELASIRASLEEGRRGSLRMLFQKGFRLALVIALVLAVMQQFTGVSAVAYYAPLIFQQTGMSTNASLVETIALGAIKVLFVVGLMYLIDRFGRKRLLLYGAAAMGICLFGLGAVFTANSFSRVLDVLILALILLHTIAFELSWGGGVWIVISEIFPTSIRGRATSIASYALWAATYLVTQLFPMMLKDLGPVYTFVIFGVMCVIMFFFTLFVLPETGGKTLEEIQTYWASKK